MAEAFEKMCEKGEGGGGGVQQEEDACVCTASLKTNKSIEMETKIDGETEPTACVLCFRVHICLTGSGGGSDP